MVAARPTMAEVVPALTASAPSSAPTVLCSSTFIGAGRAPARSSTARSLALSTVKWPWICPEPPWMALSMTGAEITFLSRTMAKRLPMFWRVMSPNFREPMPLKRKDTTGWLVCESKVDWALVSISPVTTCRRFTR